MRIALVVGLTLLAGSAYAQQPFTPGDVVVYRVGSGTGSLSATGNPVFLDEFSPAGVLVQTIPMPTSANGLQRPLVASGTATTDGLLTRSADGTCLVVPGYGRDISITTGNLTSTAGIPRIVAKVTAQDTIDTTTALADAAIGGNFRGVASTDCVALWTTGSPSGVRTSTVGATTSLDLTSPGLSDTRGVAIYGGQLFAWNSNTGSKGIGPVGSGTPTSNLQTVTRLPGMTDANSPNTYQFLFADLDAGVAGIDTLYIADAGAGALTKFSLRPTGWVARGTIGVAGDVYRGLTGSVNGTSVTLFATRRTGTVATPGGELVAITDSSGYDGAFAGVPTAIATAGANTVFRGVALAPAITITPSAGANGGITPATPQIVAGGASSTFTVTPDAGYSALVGGTCGGTLVGSTFTTNPASLNCTVVASFAQIPMFAVTPGAGANGTITPNVPQVVSSGSSASFVVTPAFGYSASVDGTCGGTLSGGGAGGNFVTNPVTADCTVSAVFTPLPRYTVTPLATPNGTVTPAAPQSVLVGQSAAFTLVAAPGYSTAIRGTCGGSLAGNTFTTNPVTRDCTVIVAFARKLVLFVGNSYTHGRVDPVLSYNASHVTDLTQDMFIANPIGSNDDEPHPWGGIPGIFKQLTDDVGLDYDVSISARSSATLRGHYLNTNPAGWDLRGNIASQAWDAVILQDLSDEPLPANRGVNANLPYFNAYVDKIEAWVHGGAAETFTESQLFGGSASACSAITGASASACDTVRAIAPANTNARPGAEVFLYETWARPDMIGPHGDNASGQFYTAAEGLEAMTADFHDAYFGRAAANPNIAAVSPVGDAFLRAVQEGVAMRDPYVPEAGKIDLWHTDFFHPSKYGSYLSALVHFATITGLDPMALGGNEQAAVDLGIAPDIAAQLQRIARSTVTPDTTAPVTTAAVSVPANANGWNTGTVTVTFSAADNAHGWGVGSVAYSLTGAQSGSASVPPDGAIAISAEGVTTITYFATDLAGNSEIAHTLMIRIDSTPPVISAPGNFVVDATGPAGAGVSYSVTAADNSGLAPVVACVPASGSVLAIGTSAIACTAVDAAGNVAQAAFNVVVSGAAAQTAKLIAAVLAIRGVTVGPVVMNVITAFLQRALSSGNNLLFCAELSGFARQVALLSGRGIPAPQAAALVASANQIRSVQSCR